MPCAIGKSGWLVGVLVIASGCASTANVEVRQEFPAVVAQPRDIHVTLVLTEEFRSYTAQPNADVRITFGSAQVKVLDKAFRGLFREVSVVPSKEEVAPETELVITPSVREVQVSSPDESYLNVYEVWIEYSLDIETADGVPIDSWFLPAYGKTQDSMMLSRTQAIRDATVVALRDAGAKLILDFFRIPAIYGWLESRRSGGE